MFSRVLFSRRFASAASYLTCFHFLSSKKIFRQYSTSSTMTILPKNFSGTKKSHRKPAGSQLDHGQHQRGHSKKVSSERTERVHQQQRHLIPTPQNQEEPLNSDDEYGQGFKDEEVNVVCIQCLNPSVSAGSRFCREDEISSWVQSQGSQRRWGLFVSCCCRPNLWRRRDAPRC